MKAVFGALVSVVALLLATNGAAEKNIISPEHIGLGANMGANASVSLRASLFQTLFQDLIPLIESVGTEIPIPADSGKHWSFVSFNISSLSIGNITIGFTAPNVLNVGLIDVTGSVPHTDFSVFTHIFDDDVKIEGRELNPDFKVSCDGQFWGTITGATVNMAIPLTTDANGKLALGTIVPSIQYGAVSISHSLDSTICKVGAAIISIFIGNINNFVKELGEKKVPGKLVHIIDKFASKSLPKLPLTFVSQPAVVDNTMSVTVQLIPPFGGVHQGLHIASSPLMEFPASARKVGMPFTNRDVAIGINSQSVNDAIGLLAMLNKFSFNKTLPGDKVNTSILELFIPAAYAKCPSCPFSFDFALLPNSPPIVSFANGTLEFSIVNAVLGVNAVNPTTNAYDDLFDVYLNLTFSMSSFSITNYNNTSNIMFRLGVETFGISLDSSAVGHFDVNKVGTALDYVLQNVLVPLFNAEFKGYPLTIMKDGFGLDRWLIEISGDSIILGADIVIPPL